MLNRFENISCYEEFEIQCALTGISKIDVLKVIGHQIDNYYFFVSNDGIFNWYDLEGNYVKEPGVLTTIIYDYIPQAITRCIIPNSVTSIGESAFKYCKSLTSITIPNSITSIDDGAFHKCISLKEITIPNSVTYIGDEVFYNCESLKEITIPNGVTSIGNDAFYNCKSLKEITIPNGVTCICIRAFSRCKSLTSITIPDSVTNIGLMAFFGCESLKEIIFKGKTLNEVKRMGCYPFGIEDESIIKCEM